MESRLIMEKVYYDALWELKNYNMRLIGAAEDIVELLRGQREDQALELFIAALDGINWVLEVTNHTQQILKSYGFDGDMSNVNSVLTEMMQALQYQDYVLLGDLLEYEILPFLKELQAAVDKMGLSEPQNVQ